MRGNAWFIENGLRAAYLAHHIPGDPNIDPQPGILPGGGHGWDDEYWTSANIAVQSGIGVLVPLGKKHLIIRQDIGAFAIPLQRTSWNQSQLLFTQLSIGLTLGHH